MYHGGQTPKRKGNEGKGGDASFWKDSTFDVYNMDTICLQYVYNIRMQYIYIYICNIYIYTYVYNYMYAIYIYIDRCIQYMFTICVYQ